MTRGARLTLVALAAAACGGDAEPTEIGDGTENVSAYDLTFAGNGYAIAWTTDARRLTDERLWFTHVSRDGRPTREPTAVADLGIQVGALQLFALPTGGYVVWFRDDVDTDTAVQAIALDGNGDALGPPVTMFGASALRGTPAVASGGDRFAIATVTSGSAIGYRVIGAQLDPIGEGIVEASVDNQVEPSIAWAPAEQRWIVTWRERETIRAARLLPDGTAAGPSVAVAASGVEQAAPGVAASEAGAIVAWLEDGGRRVAFASASGDGWAPRGSPVPDSRYDTIDAALSARGAEALLVWSSDATTALRAISAVHIDLVGGAFDEPLALTTGAGARERPRVAAGIDEHGVLFAGPQDGVRRLYFTTVE